MWWKLTLAALFGIGIGIAGTTAVLYLFRAAARDMRAEYIPREWSSAGRRWPPFAERLRHGSRKLLEDAAFSAARDGMTENEVRTTFGPPDSVVVGPEESKARSVAQMSGSAGAYFYKVGRFATIPDKLFSEVFAIVFDRAGKVMYRMGFGVNDGDQLADIDSDTRSERRIAP
jgi:hypothetical protein